MADELVTVAQYRDLPEALLAKGKIESAGVFCQLADDNVVRMDWFWANAVGGVKLQVESENAEAALALLQDSVPEKLPANGSEYRQPRCPRCGSIEVSDVRLNRPLSYFLMWLGLPLPVPARHWECSDCAARWKWEGAGDFDDPPRNEQDLSHEKENQN
jgi:hypothetical protein